MTIVFWHWRITLVRTWFHHILQLLTICIVRFWICVIMTHRYIGIHFIIAISIERMMMWMWGFWFLASMVWIIWWNGRTIGFVRSIQFVNAIGRVYIVQIVLLRWGRCDGIGTTTWHRHTECWSFATWSIREAVWIFTCNWLSEIIQMDLIEWCRANELY